MLQQITGGTARQNKNLPILFCTQVPMYLVTMSLLCSAQALREHHLLEAPTDPLIGKCFYYTDIPYPSQANL